ncbi:MAG: hypothetical protein D6765_17555, partial [Bacteroidetes bacterium]
EDNRPADVLQLTFEGVGDTPQNKYHVWVDQETRLVSQWAYFPEATDSVPRFVTPWKDYQPYGNILLASDRGRGKITEIAVYDSLPDSVFTSFAEVKR